MTAISAIPAPTPQTGPAPQPVTPGPGGLFATLVVPSAAVGIDGATAAETASGAQPSRRKLLAGLETALVGLGAPVALSSPSIGQVGTSTAVGLKEGGAPASGVGPDDTPMSNGAPPQLSADPAAGPDATDADGLSGKQARGHVPQALAAAGVVELAAKSETLARNVTATPDLAQPSAPTPPAAATASVEGAGGSGADKASATEAKPASPTPKGGDVVGGPDTPFETQAGAAKPAETSQQGHARGEAAASADRPAVPPQTAAAPATPSAQNPHAAPQTTAASAAAQVAREIASHAGGRRTRFEVRLDPAELGRVDVRLDIAHDGRVATRLIVERPETLDMLRHDARELARTLEQAGFQLGQGGLAFQLRDGRRGTFQDLSAIDGSAARGAGEEEADAAAAPSPRRSLADAGGVDMTV